MPEITEVRVQRDVSIDGERFAVVVTTEHRSGARAMTAVHRQGFARRIGGVRVVGERSEAQQLREAARLSAAMTWKCAAADLPADGQKSVVVAPGRANSSHEETVALLRAHEHRVREVDPGVIFGPDMNVDERIQDALQADPELADNVTGLSEQRGGLAIDKHGYTAQGLEAALVSLPEFETLRTVAVQGFGAVGGHLAVLLRARGMRVVAVCTIRGTLADPDGIDADALLAETFASGEEALPRLRHRGSGSFDHDPSRIFSARADVFVPAARTSVLVCSGEVVENPDARLVEAWFDEARPAVVLEGANAPLTTAAEQWLESRGVRILPDYIVNCGGLIGCWVEHQQRARLLDDPAARPGVHAEALSQVRRVVADNVRAIVQVGGSIRVAARNVAEANRARLLAREGRTEG